ncbi:MAG: MbnP family protein [Bacteroidota bacterium]|jgi:hypothetical protein
MKLLTHLYILSAFLFLMVGCEEKDPPANQVITPTDFNGIRFTESGTLTVNFEEVFSSLPLKLDPDSFITLSGDTVKITDLKYYISHVSFIRSNGQVYNSQNHKLVDFGNANNGITLNVPAGDYSKITFLLGVDSFNNHAGPLDGDLDPSLGMFWGWNTGYIFYRLKGWHGINRAAIAYDIGGVPNLIKVELDLQAYKVNKNSVTVKINHDVARFFNAPNIIQLKNVVNQIHTADNPFIPTLKANMGTMFSLKSVE